MDRYFRLQLTITLMVFSLIISFASALFDYNKLTGQVRTAHENKIELAGETIINSLSTLDKIYNITDRTNADKMKENTEVMLALYEQNPDFNTWDFDALKEQFGMDIFIINAENTVINSSFKQDIGLKFDEYHGDFAEYLDEVRESGSFYHDGIDIQQATGQIKSFSYMATPDQQYLLELSLSLEEDELFKQFNFLDTIRFLEANYEAIHSINVYTQGGLILGYTDNDGKSKEINHEMRPALRQALETGKAQVVVQDTKQGTMNYRYIPYTAEDQPDFAIKRVVEIYYNEIELEGLLKFYRNNFINQQFFILFSVIVLSMVLARLLAKPIHLAFHDSLTGLKNRAAFETEIEKRLRKKNTLVALMMIDIDHFKRVNDELGHIEGDKILVHTAQAIEEVVGKRNIAARLGGDEFVVIFSDVKKEEITQIATSMLTKINHKYIKYQNEIDVSISIGIAYAVEGEQSNTLYDKADKALYMSKENGKNQYRFYNSSE